MDSVGLRESMTKCSREYCHGGQEGEHLNLKIREVVESSSCGAGYGMRARKYKEFIRGPSDSRREKITFLEAFNSRNQYNNGYTHAQSMNVFLGSYDLHGGSSNILSLS
jgi:hypothetical protein